MMCSNRVDTSQTGKQLRGVIEGDVTQSEACVLLPARETKND